MLVHSTKFTICPISKHCWSNMLVFSAMLLRKQTYFKNLKWAQTDPAEIWCNYSTQNNPAFHFVFSDFHHLTAGQIHNACFCGYVNNQFFNNETNSTWILGFRTWSASNWSPPKADTHGFIPPVPTAITNRPADDNTLRIILTNSLSSNSQNLEKRKTVRHLVLCQLSSQTQDFVADWNSQLKISRTSLRSQKPNFTYAWTVRSPSVFMEPRVFRTIPMAYTIDSHKIVL